MIKHHQFSACSWLAVAMMLTSCGGETPTVSAQPCSQNEVSSGRLSIANCLSARSKKILITEYKRRIDAKSLMIPQGGFDPRYYPAEVIASVYALGLDAGDTQLVKWGRDELDHLDNMLQSHNGYLKWPIDIDGEVTFGELAQSRVVFSLGLINARSPSEVTRRLIKNAYLALDRLPRVEVYSSFTSNKYLLPSYAFHNVVSPTAISFRSLDPNHDAALAAAYSIAADTIQGTAENQYANQMARYYFNAALDMANNSTCLPLADQPEYRNDCDTRYNGFWLALMIYTSQKLKMNNADLLLNHQYSVIRAWSKQFYTSRTYPNEYTGPYPDPVEPLLLGVAVAKFDDQTAWKQYLDKLNAMIEGSSNSSIEAWPAGWLYPALSSAP